MFTNLFMKELTRLRGTELHLVLPIVHNWISGQRKSTNTHKTTWGIWHLANYILCKVVWSGWVVIQQYLPLQHSHASICSAHDYLPPLLMEQKDSTTSVANLETWMKERREINRLLSEQILVSQSKMKQFADARRMERESQEGDWVWLKLQLYCLSALALWSVWKSFQNSINNLWSAYKLILPPKVTINSMFYMSMSKKYEGNSSQHTSILPITDTQGQILVESKVILQKRTIHRRGKPMDQILVT